MTTEPDMQPVTDDDRRELAECAETAPLADDAFTVMLEQFDPDLTVTVFARAAITDEDLTRVDLAWLYSYDLLRISQLTAELARVNVPPPAAPDVDVLLLLTAYGAAITARTLSPSDDAAAAVGATAEAVRVYVAGIAEQRDQLRHHSEQLNTIGYALAVALGKVEIPHPYDGNTMELWREFVNRTTQVTAEAHRLRVALDAANAAPVAAIAAGVDLTGGDTWLPGKDVIAKWSPAGGRDEQGALPTRLCGASGPGGSTCTAAAGHSMAHWAGGVRTTTWTDHDKPTATTCGVYSGRYPVPNGVYCTLTPGHDGFHRTRRGSHVWTWGQTQPGQASLRGRNVVDEPCTDTTAHGQHYRPRDSDEPDLGPLLDCPGVAGGTA